MPEEIYPERSIELTPGDRLLFYTDGVADCRDERGETFGTQRLREALAEHSSDMAPQIAANLLDDLKRFRGTAKPVDDMTLVVAEIR
jgi:sigma-B regulation protein RsbU (phosphoserine phosphatase)